MCYTVMYVHRTISFLSAYIANFKWSFLEGKNMFPRNAGDCTYLYLLSLYFFFQIYSYRTLQMLQRTQNYMKLNVGQKKIMLNQTKILTILIL